MDVTFSESTEGTLKFRLEKDGTVIGEKECKVKGSVINAKWAVENVKLWDINTTELYNLYVSFNNEDEYKVRFGFREVKFRKDGFYLNGKKIKELKPWLAEFSGTWMLMLEGALLNAVLAVVGTASAKHLILNNFVKL